MENPKRTKKFGPYQLLMATLALFVAYALATEAPKTIWEGLGRIYTSRGLLVSDFIAIGSVGSALVNAAINGTVFIGLSVRAKLKPNGATLMAIGLIIGFSFFGKTLFNMLPAFFGVWLYAMFQGEPFLNFSLVALLSSTLCPIVTSFAFSKISVHSAFDVFAGLLVGVLAGFFMPIVSSATNRVHGGYSLSNIGFAGGIVAIFIVAFCKSLDIVFEAAGYISAGNNLSLAALMYAASALWCAAGIAADGWKRTVKIQRKIMGHSGRLVTDYYLLYGESAYFNMGLMGILGTSSILFLGGEINGLTIAGIFTMIGFGAFGEHPRNSAPVMAGAVIWALINNIPPNDPANLLAILFCTCLCPISGQFGWRWGMVAGAVHCCVVAQVGQVTGGLNLYNNGFATGFVALVLVPVILAVRRRNTE